MRRGISGRRSWLSIAMTVSVCLALPSTASAQYRPSAAEVASAKERGEAAAESDWSNAKRSTPSINEAAKKMNEAFDCHKGRVLTPDRASLSRYCEDHGWWNGITETVELIGYSNRFWALVTPWQQQDIKNSSIATSGRHQPRLPSATLETER